ncbi:MAG: arylsulfatase [Planctomycetota bacterium]|jgi:arylsulfatase A-like enzyme
MKQHLFLLIVLLWTIAGSAEGKPPNIIFIMADDLGYGDLGCYGQTLIKTPNIDRLAAQGIRFTQAYAGSTVCAPSRGILMTGLHNGHAPVRDNVPHYQTYLRDQDITLAEVLKQAGYRCGGIGKWSLGDPSTEGRPTNQGFEGWLGYLNQDHAHYYYPEYLDDGEGRRELPGNSKSREHYSHDLMTEWALRFIRESQTQPFFLYAAYTVPHFANSAEDRTQFPVISDAPYGDRNWTQAEKNYAAMVTLLDTDVGRIVELSRELKIDKRTLIIVTSDNGPWSGAPMEKFHCSGPLRGHKRTLYEGGIRVPFIAHWPGVIPANRISHEVITFWDMLPTLAEIARAQVPENIDGLSVWKALKGQPLEQAHRYLYWDYGHCRTRYDQAVRLGTWKGLRHGIENEIQLYNLESDVQERFDVADQHPAIVQKIAEIMQTAAVPSERYPIGKIYQGRPIWRSTWTHE